MWAGRKHRLVNSVCVALENSPLVPRCTIVSDINSLQKLFIIEENFESDDLAGNQRCSPVDSDVWAGGAASDGLIRRRIECTPPESMYVL